MWFWSAVLFFYIIEKTTMYNNNYKSMLMDI